MGSFNSFNKFGVWTGASGMQIGYADEYPEDRYDAFTADPIHNMTVDPNDPNSYAQVGTLSGDVPINIQGDPDEFVDYGDANGFIMDDLAYPDVDQNPGTAGHDVPYGAAKSRLPDIGHTADLYQDFPAPGHGVDFYGKSIDTLDLAAWSSDKSPANSTSTFPAQAREVTIDWPIAFDSTKVAPLLPVVRDTEAIPMRRMEQDDRPIYRSLAVPGQNTEPTGGIYNPTYESNVYVQNVTPIPAMPRTPIDPYVSQEALSQYEMQTDDSVDVGGGWQ